MPLKSLAGFFVPLFMTKICQYSLSTTNPTILTPSSKQIQHQGRPLLVIPTDANALSHPTSGNLHIGSRPQPSQYTLAAFTGRRPSSHSTHDSSPSMSCVSLPLSWSTVGSLWQLSTSLFPPNHSLPRKCLYSLRVWLRHQNVNQRIFTDGALCVGTNPNFSVIPDAVLATVWHKAPDQQFYKCLVGHAEVNFVLQWVLVLVSYLSLRVSY